VCRQQSRVSVLAFDDAVPNLVERSRRRKCGLLRSTSCNRKCADGYRGEQNIGLIHSGKTALPQTNIGTGSRNQYTSEATPQNRVDNGRLRADRVAEFKACHGTPASATTRR
jgi:hypothetical protein